MQLLLYNADFALIYMHHSLNNNKRIVPVKYQLSHVSIADLFFSHWNITAGAPKNLSRNVYINNLYFVINERLEHQQEIIYTLLLSLFAYHESDTCLM